MSVQCKNCRSCYVFDKDKNQYCCGATRNMCLTNIKKQRMCQYFIKKVK
ncbi:MAG: hypothetical protein E6469_13205 [Clostridium perfringens]|nr:hypothetical protein [Clostridium perfringens]MDU6691761.1 hypothetical protein [Clostridium perfringens]